jgi:hypothetical protein
VNITTTTTVNRDKIDIYHYYLSHLQRIRQIPLIEKNTKINQLDIADGLKELLINHGFTLELLQNISSSAADLAETLCIDKYVAKIIIDAAKKKS